MSSRTGRKPSLKADHVKGSNRHPKTKQRVSPLLTLPSCRVTDTHIFFHGGVFSNWHLKSPNFAGSKCLEYLLPQLDKRAVVHPSSDEGLTRLLSAHQFNCGEQWMMAVKAWLFEGAALNSSDTTSKFDTMDDQAFEQLRDALKKPAPDSRWAPDSVEKKLYHSTACSIMRAKVPRDQKALGRTVKNFDQIIWDAACMPAVTASCIARAEHDHVLRQAYIDARDRVFVEGSSRDTIWGVGVDWKDERIDDEANWIGENKLGKCHGEAAVFIRSQT